MAEATGGAWGPWDSPIFLIEAGDSGSGKTTNAIYTAAGRGVFVGLPGSFKSAIGAVGFEIKPSRLRIVHTIEQATDLLPRIAEAGVKAGVDMVVVDDISELLRTSAQLLKANYPKSQTFDLWDHIGMLVSNFRNTARSCGLHVYATAHLASPTTEKDSGAFHKGGPEVPGKKLTRLLPHLSDTCVRVSSDMGRELYPWPGVWECSPPDPNYHVKDRHGARGTIPQNTSEFMRTFCGYPTKPVPGYEWIAALTDQIAESMLAGTSKAEVKAKVEEKGREKSWSPLHMRWAWRDGYDRAVYTKIKAESAFNF